MPLRGIVLVIILVCVIALLCWKNIYAWMEDSGIVDADIDEQEKEETKKKEEKESETHE